MALELKNTENGMTRRTFLAASGAAAGAAVLGAAADDASAGEQLKKFAAFDVRDKSGKELEDIPYSYSNGRLTAILYGENEHVKDAVGYAAKYYADHTPENVVVRFLWAKDNDDSPNDSMVGIYANGRHYGDITIGIRRDAKEIALEIVKHLNVLVPT